MISATCRQQLDQLRERVLGGDNAAAFIDRETALADLSAEAEQLPFAQRYAFLLAGVLDRATTPIDPNDVVLGRMREERLPPDWQTPYVPGGLDSFGHLAPDYATLLAKGLSGIAADARATADRLGDDESRSFADSTTQCVEAIQRFAARYAAAADANPNAPAHRAAQALQQVPFGPARTFFEALQSVWFIHMILSCFVGSRDFAFGRMDQWLLPYFRRDLETGVTTRQQMLEDLTHFLMKTNEITGTTAHNFKQKPIPSNSSKQYLILGGCDEHGSPSANELTHLILDAACQIRMPEPVLVVRLSPDYPQPHLQKFTATVDVLRSQLHFYNDDIIIPVLCQLGLPPEAAADYSMIGCCRTEIPGCMAGLYSYHYHNMAEWLMMALKTRPANSMEDILAGLQAVANECVGNAVSAVAADRARQPAQAFHLESLFLQDCVARGRDYSRGGARYTHQGHQLGAIATVANSLTAIDRLVFQEKRFTLDQFLKIVADEFNGHEDLRKEIRTSFPTFGNDDPIADGWATRAANAVLDGIEPIQSPDFLFTGFYSLDLHHQWGRSMPATPDGRLQGEPISENQSPVYGTDKKGITAVLRSVAALPLRRTVLGGLNIKYGAAIPQLLVQSLLKSYFQLGGLHVGFTMVDRATLVEARDYPDRHRSLCVRLYGFSEYFTCLSPEEQEEMIARTEFVV